MTIITDLDSHQTNPTLESVHEAFTAWRQQCKPKEKIPDRLWNMVRPLIGPYKKTHIMSRLSINGAQLKQAGILPSSVNKRVMGKPFVNVELSTLASPCQTVSPSTQQPRLILERGDSRRLILNDPTESQIALSIQAFWN